MWIVERWRRVPMLFHHYTATSVMVEWYNLQTIIFCLAHSWLEVWENVWLFSWSMILYFTLKKCMLLYVWDYIWLTDSWKIGEYDTICMRLYILPIGRTVPYLIYHREFQYFSRIPFLKSLLAHKEFNNIDQLENGFENCRISKWNNLCVCFWTKPELKHQTLSKSYN